MRKFSWFGMLAASSACARWLGSAGAGEPAPNEASSPMVWVSAKSPADGITWLAVGTGLLAFAGGTIIGGVSSIFTGEGEYKSIPSAVSMGTILPFTVVPGLIMMPVGAVQAARGARTKDESGAFLARRDVEHKRAYGRTLTIAGAIITGLSTVAIAAGSPLFTTCINPYSGCNSPAQDAGLWLMALSVPLSIVGTVTMGYGVNGYVKYNHALNPHQYENQTSPALNSFRLAPYASQSGSGLLLSGTF